MIYLDYAASTPVDDQVLDTFYRVSKKYYANPNSIHKFGVETKNLIDNSTIDIANKLGVLKEEIIYTSGASESNNLVIKGICERYKNRGKHILISSLEHNSIVASATAMQELGFEVEIIPVKKDGFIDIDALKKMMRQDTILVSICSVDSELGLKQPIEEIGEFLKEYPNCYLVTITPHKFYGLNGFGILIKKKNLSLKPQINGGKSTTVYRSGTPEVANIVACDKALTIALDNLNERYSYIENLSNIIKNTLSQYKDIHINNTVNSIPHTINFSINGIKSIDVLKKLEKYDIYVSTKTSCCPIETPSKLVYALTRDKNLSSSSIRLSLSHLTTVDEVNEFLSIFDIIYKEYEVNGKRQYYGMYKWR